MRSIRKTLLGIVLVSSALVLLAALLLPRLLDVNQYRDALRARLQESLGREVEVGKLNVSLLPPGVRVHDVAILARPDEGTGPLFTLKSARAGVAILPLLQRRVQITSLVLDKPTIDLTRGRDGTWQIARTAGPVDNAAPKSAKPGSAKPASAKPASTKPGSTKPGSTKPGSAKPGSAKPSGDVSTVADAVAPVPPDWLQVDRLAVRDGRVTVRAGDRSATLDELSLDIADLSFKQPFKIDLSTRVPADGGKLNVKGSVDVLRGDARRIDLTIDLAAVVPRRLAELAELISNTSLPATSDVPLSGSLNVRGELTPTLALELETKGLSLVALKPFFADHANMIEAGDLDIAVNLNQPQGGALTTRGTIALSGGQFVVPQPEGGPRKVGVEFTSQFARAPSGQLSVALERLVLKPGTTPLNLSGELEIGPKAGGTLDLKLAPARLPVDELMALAAGMKRDLPISFRATAPVEIEARIHGPFGNGKAPAIDGRASVRGATLSHTSLERPLDELDADLVFTGQQLDITGLRGRFGTTRLDGSISIADFAAPRIHFDLHAPEADLDELMGASSNDAPAAATTTGARDPSGAAELTLEGKLRVDRGKLRGVAFQELAGNVRFARGVATLDPLAMNAYGGEFSGRARYDMRSQPSVFELDGTANGIDIGTYLTATTGNSDVFSGRLSGRLKVAGRGTAKAEVLQSLNGGGDIRVDKGRVGQVAVLERLSKVSGVFGEKALAELSGKLGRSGTEFDRMAADVAIGQGDLRLTKMVLESPDFALTGGTVVDLISDQLEGDLEIAFSDAISQAMYLDGSRAAEVFRDARTRQVKMPFKLKGATAAPAASVDWTKVASRVVEREVTKQLGKKVGGLLSKLGLGGKSEPNVQQELSGNTSKLGVEITEVRWGGSFLVRDLKATGRAHGSNLDHATAILRDDNGKEIRRIERLPGFDKGGSSVTWSASFEGKKLLTQRFPLKLEVTVYDRSGATATTSKQVTR